MSSTPGPSAAGPPPSGSSTPGSPKPDPKPTGPPPLPSVRPGLALIVIPGTLLWLAGFVVLLFYTDELRAHQAMTWLWTCVAGVALGLVGLGIASWQRSAARRGHRGAQTSALDVD